MSAALETLKRWRIFCPRCGDEFIRSVSRTELTPIIDRACRRCHKMGVDAVEIEP